LGLLFPIYGKHMFQTTNQGIYWNITTYRDYAITTGSAHQNPPVFNGDFPSQKKDFHKAT
jgi:hypothetical protein